MSSVKSALIERMRELDIEPKRSLGQNFLIDEYVIDQIVQCVRALDPERIVEIGPGLGALTEKLMNLKKWLVVVELDRKIAAYWRKRGVEVIETDALELDERQLDGGGGKWALVSNLPYQISSRLVIEQSFTHSFESMILMFQKEVAERLLARPRTHDYGLLSIIAQTFWSMEVVVDASPESFYPKPNVASRVLKFTRKASVTADRDFLTFVKRAFQFRRKFLTKNLKGDMARLKAELAAMGLNETARPEELSVEQYLLLYRKLMT